MKEDRWACLSSDFRMHWRRNTVASVADLPMAGCTQGETRATTWQTILDHHLRDPWFGNNRCHAASPSPYPDAQRSSPQDGVIQTYTIPHCAQPPANVDLSTLSDHELAQYGLPPRPTNAAAVQIWAEALRHAKHRSCEYQIRSLQQRGIPHTSEWDNNHWAGNMAYGGGYSQASANWNANCPSGGGSAYVSAWAGLGAYP